MARNSYNIIGIVATLAGRRYKMTDDQQIAHGIDPLENRSLATSVDTYRGGHV